MYEFFRLINIGSRGFFLKLVNDRDGIWYIIYIFYILMIMWEMKMSCRINIVGFIKDLYVIRENRNFLSFCVIEDFFW